MLNSIGQIILEQMGGARRIQMMLGATFVNVPDGVGIKWPNREVSRGNYVEIILDPSDTYNVTFYALRGGSKRPVKSLDDVYAEDLIHLFEKQTGWYLRMGSEGQMSMYSSLVKLAHDVPETRKHLLPLLRKEAWGRRFSPNRDFYLPAEVKGTEPEVPEGTDLAVYRYEVTGMPFAIVFKGKANKPLWHHRFTSSSSRESYINKTVEAERKRAEAILQRRQERSEFSHDMKVGDILYSSWGYDQTNIDYYQVTRVLGKAVEIRKLEANVIEGGGGGPSEDLVTPIPNRFSGPPMRKLPQKGYQGKTYIKLTSYSNAYPWDGKPKHQTNPMFGH